MRSSFEGISFVTNPEEMEKFGEVSEAGEDNLIVANENGKLIVQIESYAHLEEDLAQMEKGDGILTQERHQQLKDEAFYDVLEGIKGALSDEAIQKVFPGMSMENIQSYNLNDARFKVHILNTEDHLDVVRGLYEYYPGPEEGFGASAAVFGSPDSIDSTSRRDNEITRINFGSQVAVIREQSSRAVKEMGYTLENAKAATEGDNGEELVHRLESDLRNRIRHELLHALGVGKDFPKDVTESVVEYYANKFGAHRKEDVSGEYSKTDYLSDLIELTKELGVEETVMDNALLCNNMEAMQSIQDKFEEKFGVQIGKRLLNFDFRNSEEGQNYIRSLRERYL